MALLSRIARRIGLARPAPRRAGRAGEVRRVEDPAEARRTAFVFGRRGGLSVVSGVARLNELLALRSPALYLQVRSPAGVRVVLEPWDQRKVSLCGSGWSLDAGAAAPAGTAAWTAPLGQRPHRLYEAAPDHPVLAVAVDAGEDEVRCFFPEYLTHATVVVNGRVLAAAQRLEHAHGAHVFVDRGRAA